MPRLPLNRWVGLTLDAPRPLSYLHSTAALLVTLVALATFPGLTVAAAESGWKVGLASVNITPTQPLMLAGYATRNRPFDKVEDELFAKALVFQDSSGNRGVMITADLIGFTAAVAEPICERLREKAGLRREQIVLNASHIHTGPTLDLNEMRRGMFSAEDARNTVAYTRWLQDQVVGLVERALAELKPATLSWGVGLASFAMNRREFTPTTVKLGINPRGLVDRSVPVLRIDGTDGKPRAVLFGYACHNTTLGPTDYMVSGDYAGAAQRRVAGRFPGVQAMFMTGCAGDANPYPRGSLDIARQHGATLADEVCRVLETKLVPIRGSLTCVFARAHLPVRQMDRNELDRMALVGNAREKATAVTMLAELDRGVAQPTSYPAPLAVWQFGQDLTWVGLSGEVVVEFVPLIEKAIGPLQLWISAYNNDVFGYIPSARVVAEGGYEARGIYTINGLFTSEAETVLVNKVRDLAAQAGRKPVN